PAAATQVVRQLLERGDIMLDVQVGALLLAAACELQATRTESARACLDKALDLAEPEGLRRCLEEVPVRLRSIIRERCEVRGGRRSAAITTKASGAAPPRYSDRVIITQPLTERETEVLAYLAELLPTEEIAGQMFVSVNTVKTHIRAILRKLGVERRNEAVRRARDLGLV
ncbi:MAG TPA: LuxR C-terminal-related transcriptional regulator, partial [Kineosporiaceae bacterium]